MCRDTLFSQARRWYDRETLVASKDEFFDAKLIPRRRAHRRLRKRHRAGHRNQQRQQRRRAHMAKRRWPNVLAKGDRKRQIQQHQQRDQLEQKEVEIEAAEVLLQESGVVQAILKKQATQLVKVLTFVSLASPWLFGLPFQPMKTACRQQLS